MINLESMIKKFVAAHKQNEILKLIEVCNFIKNSIT